MGSEATIPEWDPEHLRAAINAAGVGLWSWNVETDRIGLDQRSLDLWDLRGQTVATFRDLSVKIHPKDLDRVRAAFTATRAIVGPYEIDFRILSGDDIRWISARGQGSDADIVHGVLRGVFLDVTLRKRAEESQRLLAGEMSHRVHNLLLVASALAKITAHSTTTTEEMAQDLTDRLMALGRAHDLARPRGGQPVNTVLLADLLAVLLQAYDETDGSSGRIRIAVPRIDMSEAATRTLALMVHELATNSLKYGALSVPTGTLDISGTFAGEEVALVWIERGGPPVVEPAEGLGYGSEMMGLSVTQQFEGSINHDWSPEGLIVTLRLRRERFTA